MSLDRTWTALRRHWLAASSFFVAAIVSGGWAIFAISPVYHASAQVMLRLGQEDVYMPVLPSSSSEVRTPLMINALEQQANSEIRIIRSDPLIKQLVAQYGPSGLFPGINARYPWYTLKGARSKLTGLYHRLFMYMFPQSDAGDTVSWAERAVYRNLTVTPVRESTVIEITMANTIPEIAASSLNELLRLYLARRAEIYSHDNGEVFSAQLAKVTQYLAEASRRLEDFRATNNVLDVEQQRDAILKRLTDAKSSFQDETVAVTSLRGQIEVLKSQINDNMPISRIPLQNRIMNDLLKAQADLSSHEAAQRILGVLIKEMTVQADRLLGLQNVFVQLQQHVRVLNEARKLYLQKVEEARVQQAIKGNVSVVNWAETDRTLVSPKLGIVIPGLFVFAVISSIGFACLIDWFRDVVCDEDELLRLTGMPVIGWVEREVR